MGKKRFLIVTVYIVLLILAVWLGSKHSVRIYLQGWISETQENIIHIYNDSHLCFDSSKINLNDLLEEGVVEDIYCVDKDRLYFCYSTATGEYPRRCWHIASTTLEGEDLIIHFSKDITMAQLSGESQYHKLSYSSSANEEQGGMYNDGKVYLLGNQCVYVYDIECDEVYQADKLPEAKYRCEINANQSIRIEDLQDKKINTITFENVIDSGTYARKLERFSQRTTWEGKKLAEKFFVNVKTQDDDIFIIAQLFNWAGEAYAVLFKYDFNTNTLQYVSSYKTNDTVRNYSFVVY